jgi:hypothetical protein
VDYGGRNTSASVISLDPKYIKPYPAVTIPQNADQLINLTLGRWGSSYKWTSSGGGLYDMMANWDDPILYDLDARNNLEEQVVIHTINGTWVDVLLQLGEMPNTPAIQAPHVMHKHSSKAYILGVGPGFFNWSSTEEAAAERPDLFHMENPQMRDTFLAQGPAGPTWMMLRYQVVNPGPFLFHCHIETHMANGMAVAILDGIDAWPQAPPGAYNGYQGQTGELAPPGPYGQYGQPGPQGQESGSSGPDGFPNNMGSDNMNGWSRKPLGTDEDHKGSPGSDEDGDTIGTRNQDFPEDELEIVQYQEHESSQSC